MDRFERMIFDMETICGYKIARPIPLDEFEQQEKNDNIKATDPEEENKQESDIIDIGYQDPTLNK